MKNKWFKDNGFLNETGENLVLEVKSVMSKLMDSKDVQNMSNNELQTLGCILSKMSGDMISAVLQKKTEKSKSFQSMSDAQFEAYLKEKYGERWMLVSLTPEELERTPKLMLSLVTDTM